MHWMDQIAADLNEGLPCGDRADMLKTTVSDDDGRLVAVQIDYKFTYYYGEVCDFYCTVQPLTDYVMSLKTFKECVRDIIYEEIKHSPELENIDILNQNK